MHSGSLIVFLITACFSLSFIAEARLIDGSDNNVINPTSGTPGQPYLRAISSLNFNQNSSPVTSPTDFLGLTPSGPTTIKCTDNVPAGLYPMPRCITDVICKYNTPDYNVSALLSYRSFRRTSHFATFFGQYISFDITSSKNTNPTYPIFLPADDPFYNPNSNFTTSPYQINVPFLPANRSEGNNDTATRNPLLSGINHVTPFLDLNNIYGISDQDAINRLRDTSTNKGKLKTYIINGQEYPPKNPSDGSYIWGTLDRAFSIFTLAIQTIWVREHNRLCDELYKKHGSSWTDEQYFQEARRWVTAFYQKAVAEEYFGAVLGRPLPAYQNYDPNLVPGVDTFFSTVTFRYGHSELSDFYRIQDEYGDTLYNLALNDIKNLTLLENVGLERVLWSMILQRQEEVDVFLADATKKIINNDNIIYDLGAIDIIRSRDRGIPLYNVVRQYFGFPKAQSFADISNKSIIQENLAKIYPNGIETVEAWVGVMSEDHLDGSNFGKVMNASMVTQYTYLRDSDNFWFEKPEMFTSDERLILRNTTLRDIIIRNINNNVEFPQNIWSVQPQITLNSRDDSNYPTKIGSWSQYIVSYRIDLTHVHFKVQLQTSDGNGWFGMGFGPEDDGMKGAEFIIGIVTNGNVTLGNYHADVGGYHPPLRDDKQDPTLVPKFSMSDTKAVTVEFKRLLRPPGKKPISNGAMKYILAYSPNSNAFTYHQNNRLLFRVNFYNSEISNAASTDFQKFVKFIHGCGMFFTWCILFPISILIVRYWKHHNQHLKVHRFIQLVGGISVSAFGAAAMSTVARTQTPHAWTGLMIYALSFAELGIGLIAMWGQTSVVSVNKGYPRFTKRFHKIFGLILLLLAWINLYLGIDTYCLSYGYDSSVWKIAYCCWIAILIVTFITFDFWWRVGGAFNRMLWIKYEPVAEKTMVHAHYKIEDYVKLPEFTWEEINERVQRGAYLVVCDGLVVDFRNFYCSHPGGSQILLNVIGTDITNDFYKTHAGKIVEDFDFSEALLIPKDTTSRNYSSVLAKHTDHLRGRPTPRRKLTVAKFVDNINVRYYSREPLAQHAHSRFAKQKIASMVIGKVNEKLCEKGLVIPGDGSAYQNIERKSVEIDTKNIKFHRYKLTSKKMVNANVKCPVMSFTFSKVHQDGKDIYTGKFLPGHYIEVQSRVNDQIVIRSYTPLEGSLSKSFIIYVKIYPRGLFSQHLNEQLIGYEIQARGPFDVCNRESCLASTKAEPLSPAQKSILFSPTRLHNPYIRLIGTLPTSKTSLLNPDSPDGCWDELYMIAGGTGITPMLQLIKYYLEQSMKQKNDTNKYKRMHLLFGNSKIEDVIDGELLEDIALSSRGQLTVTYCLSEPPPGWGGLRGRIDKQKIQEWMNLMKSTFLLTPNKSQMNILQSHSIRSINMQSQSSSPTLEPQSPFMQPYYEETLQITPILQYQSESMRTLSMESKSSIIQSEQPNDNQIYEDYIISTGPILKPELLTKKSGSLTIDPDLANAGENYGMLHGKIIVSGPSGMLFTVEQALVEVGFKERNVIILH
ncbi:heme peroxidase [Gigaspora margarita]|uniref:Heme peroxidase n=1 Tax=Gigaspora margarita TaxID=4874 RepID=A0A8H4AV01_GIGMA|nr:heme peroxidase [Gigaspora margarita]